VRENVEKCHPLALIIMIDQSEFPGHLGYFPSPAALLCCSQTGGQISVPAGGEIAQSSKKLMKSAILSFFGKGNLLLKKLTL
jgi:hypothetical protein